MTLAERLRQQGLEQGLEQGRHQKAVELTLKQLRIRFGEVDDAVKARIEQGAEADFERWSERVLTAATLDQVFDDSPLD